MASATSFYGVINIAFISIRCTILQQKQHRPSPTSRHTVLAFLVPVIVEFLELKYQGKVCSPFETHPKTMSVAILSLLVYCLAYDAQLRFSSSQPKPSHARVVGGGMVVFGSLFVVSLASVLLQDSAGPVLFLLCALFLGNVLLNCRIEVFWKWLRQQMKGGLCREAEVPERHMRSAVISTRVFVAHACMDWGAPPSV